MKHKRIVMGVTLSVCVVAMTFTGIKLSDNFSFENGSLTSTNYLNKQNEVVSLNNEMLNINSDDNAKEEIIVNKEAQLDRNDCEVIEDDLSLAEEVVVEEDTEETLYSLCSVYSLEAQEEAVVESTEEVTSVTTFNELVEACKNSTNIRLDNDVTMTSAIAINKNVNLDLNGHTLSSAKSMFKIDANGNLNITAVNGGKMEITAKGPYAIFTVNGGTVNVEDGIYTSNGNWIFYVAKGNVIVEDGEFTANGKYVIYAKGGKIDLKGGTYTADNDGNLMLVANNCEFNISGGEYSGRRKYTIGVANSNFNITGGTFTAHDTPEKSAILFINKTAGNINVSNANFLSDNGLFYLFGKDRDKIANINITSGNFVSTVKDSYIGTLNEYSKFKMTGGSIEVLDGSGFGITSLDPDMTDPAIKFIWGSEESNEGPSLTTKGMAIAGNYGWSGTEIIINSGEIISKEHTAIYHPQQGKFVMNGGLVKGSNAIDAKMGQFTFNGGYIVATGDKHRLTTSHKESTENGSILITGGSSNDGSAFAIQSELYGSSESNKGCVGIKDGKPSSGHFPDETIGNSFALTINDGVFISKNHSPITLYDWNYNECQQYVDIQIKGGRFSGFPQKYVAQYEESETERGAIIDDNLTKEYIFIPSENTKDDTQYNYVHAAYYDGVALKYDFTGKDAPYYASMADAIEDRENDKDARAYIYYLLNNDNKVYNEASISKQLQIAYDKSICGEYIPDSVKDAELFESDFDAANVKYDESQYVKNNVLDEENTIATLWSPAVTFNSNGGTFEEGVENKTVIASVTSGLIDAEGYGYAEESSGDNIYATLDENGRKLELEDKYLLEIPQAPVKEGYKFIGYFYDEEGNEKFDQANTQIKENLKVYAGYEKIRKGGLVVSNTIGGSGAGALTQFEFIVRLSDKSVNGTYGDVDFVNGVAKFTLKNGESATISDLPADVKYEITEIGSNEEGVVTTVKNSEGTIKDNETVSSEFNNVLEKKEEEKPTEDNNEKVEEPADEESNEKVENSKEEENVNTGDNIIVWMIALLSQIGIIVSILRKKLNKNV